MATIPRRNLRNCNTCPVVANPLALKEEGQQLDGLLPESLRTSLPTPTLTCAQIASLPTLLPPRATEDALRHMQAATEWQAGSVRELRDKLNGEERKGEEGEGSNPVGPEGRVAQVKEGPKVEMQNSIYSVLFENELQDFIMNPPPANYDFDFQYYSNLVFTPPPRHYNPHLYKEYRPEL